MTERAMAAAREGDSGMTTEMTTANNAAVALTPEIVRQYICPTATDAEIFVFIKLCESQRLNPWLKEAHLVKYGSNPATMIVGKETFTKRADRHPQFDGFRAGIIVESKGELVEREGAFLVRGETLLGGWSETYRKDRRVPHKVTVSLAEYSTGKANWDSKPATMIRKVALVQGLREAFPDAFGGLYDASEMGISDDALEGEIVRREEAPAPQQSRERPPARAAGYANGANEPAPRPPVQLTACPEHGVELQFGLLPDKGSGHFWDDADNGWCDTAAIINDRLLTVLVANGKNRQDVDELLASKGRPAWADLTLAQQHVTVQWLPGQWAQQQARSGAGSAV